MARDYKFSGRYRRRHGGPPRWVWLTAGIALLGFAGFLFYLDRRPVDHSRPLSERLVLPPEKQTKPAPTPTRKPEPTPAAAAPSKQRFDFYTILPEMEVVIPEQEVTGKPKKGLPQVEKPGVYVLQAGSFKTFDQADHLKAQLALLGLEATIESVTINGTETWRRVRVGPYRNLDELNKARALLRENNIPAVLLQIKS